MKRRALLCLAVVLPLAACDDQSMTQQNRYDTYAPPRLFPDGTEAQPLPAGVVAHGDLVARAQPRNRPPSMRRCSRAARSATTSIARPATACPATATA